MNLLWERRIWPFPSLMKNEYDGLTNGGGSNNHRSGRIQPASTTREPASRAVSEPQLWVRLGYGAVNAVEEKEFEIC